MFNHIFLLCYILLLGPQSIPLDSGSAATMAATRVCTVFRNGRSTTSQDLSVCGISNFVLLVCRVFLLGELLV